MAESHDQSAGWNAKDWMSMRELADTLGVCDTTARRFIADGHLKARVVRLSPRITRINRADVAAFMRERTALANSA